MELNTKNLNAALEKFKDENYSDVQKLALQSRNTVIESNEEVLILIAAAMARCGDPTDLMLTLFTIGLTLGYYIRDTDKI